MKATATNLHNTGELTSVNLRPSKQNFRTHTEHQMSKNEEPNGTQLGVPEQHRPIRPDPSANFLCDESLSEQLHTVLTGSN